MHVANDGTSLSTAQSFQVPLPLTVLCKYSKVTLAMFTVFAVLRGIVTTFTKEGCAWDSGLVIVNMESLSQSVSRIFIEEVPKALSLP